VKQHLAGWAADAGLYGLFSEATTAHPYSEKANVDLGAKEAGFLLAWIPATVANDAALDAIACRQAAALFYLRVNDGHERPLHVPERHRDVVATIVAVCDLRGVVIADPPMAPSPDESVVHVLDRPDHNLAVLTVEEPGSDLVAVVGEERRRRFDAGLDVLYVDLPMERPAAAWAADQLEEHGVTFAGVFPNGRVAGDVLRLQVLNEVRPHPEGISTASAHGAELLAYVLDDLARQHGTA